jgi:endonuclease/exonuclease/phosphatase (EEP) superfamily protein YafD
MGSSNQYGTTAVFSRQPIIDSYVLDLKADRPAVVVKTEIHNRPVTFISTHLLAYGLWWFDLQDIPAVVVQRTTDQNRQAQILVEEIEKQDGIVVVGCDCNSKETSSSYRILADMMKNTARQTGWILNVNGLANGKRDRNLQHIDYLFYRGPLNSLSLKVIQDRGGSDHRPVMASYSFDS